MYSRMHKRLTKASSSEPSSKSPFELRSFPVPTSITPQSKQNLQAESENNQQLGNSCPHFSIFRPGTPIPPPPRLQMKLTIGQPGDKYEQQADKVAMDVVQQINVLQRQDLVEKDKLQRSPIIQRLSGEAGMSATPELEGSIQQAKATGQPLAKNLREPMERAFGADFSGVKVHTDAQSDRLNQSIQAKAFTTGKDIFFRQGEYNPGSRGGQELIAHELTHVVQQRSDAGVVQRNGVKKMIGDVEKETRKQQAQKFKNPTKKTLEAFFANQTAERKTDPLKLQLAQKTIEKLEQHLKQKIGQNSEIDILTKAKDISDALKAIDDSSSQDELEKLLKEERPIRKALQAELETLILTFNQLGGLEAVQQADSESEIITVAVKIRETHKIYSKLSKARIAAKEKVFQEDHRDITSKNEGAKYKNLIKLEREYRQDESKKLRIDGKEIPLEEDEEDDEQEQEEILDPYGKPMRKEKKPQKEPVPYLTPEQREKYKITAIQQEEETIYVDDEDNPLDSTNVKTDIKGREQGRFIFVMSEDGDLYVASEKAESKDGQDFHHSSFLGGKPVAAAGEIAFSSGKVTAITNQSGHYTPNIYYTYQAMFELQSQGMNINNTKVDLLVKLENGEERKIILTGEGLFKFYEESGAKATTQDLNDWLTVNQTYGLW